MGCRIHVTPWRRAVIAVPGFLMLLASVGWTGAAELELRDGTRKTGEISFIAGAFKVKTRQGVQSVPPANVFEARFEGHGPKGEATSIRLAGGCFLSGTILPSSDFKKVMLRGSSEAAVEIPLADIVSIEFGRPGVSAKTKRPPGSYVLLKNGNLLECEPRWITKMDLGVETAAGALRLRLDQIDRLVFRNGSRGKGKLDDPVRILTRQGDSVTGTLLLLDRETAQLQSRWGVLTFATEDLFAVRCDPGRAVRLSGMRPVKVVETPFLDFIRPHRTDESLFGGPLRIGEMRFDSGLAVHSYSSLTYKLGAAYRRLVVVVGMDTTLTDRGRAVFVVRGDGRELEKVALTGEDAPATLSVGVTGIQSLSLVLDYGTGGSGGDHGVWADPRLVR